MFNQRNQKEGERIGDLVSGIKGLSLTYASGNIRDSSLIRHCIVGGVLSDELRGELLKRADLTLQSAQDHCGTFEAAEMQKVKFNSHWAFIRNSACQ